MTAHDWFSPGAQKPVTLLSLLCTCAMFATATAAAWASAPPTTVLSVAVHRAYPSQKIHIVKTCTDSTDGGRGLYALAIVRTATGKPSQIAFQFVNTVGWYPFWKDGKFVPPASAYSLPIIERLESKCGEPRSNALGAFMRPEPRCAGLAHRPTVRVLAFENRTVVGAASGFFPNESVTFHFTDSRTEGPGSFTWPYSAVATIRADATGVAILFGSTLGDAAGTRWLWASQTIPDACNPTGPPTPWTASGPTPSIAARGPKPFVIPPYVP